MELKEKTVQQVVQTEEKPVCGIIMPISPLDGCSIEHWGEVQKIISEAIKDAGYKPNLVSNADDVGIIQKRIIQNIYDNDIVVCDVSGKNPNVIFELGMRLAFDKPAIIIIDDKTNYSFDTSPIEHLSYPRDLRYYNILTFKEQLTKKIKATVDKAKNDAEYTTFLKNFGEFKIATIEHKEGSMNEVIFSKLEDLGNQIDELKRKPMSYNDIIPHINAEKLIEQKIRQGIHSYCQHKQIEEVGLSEKKDKEEELLEMLRYITIKHPILRRFCSPQELKEKIRTILSEY